MLDPDSTWADEFKKMKPQKTSIQGVMQLADTIEKLINKVEPNMPGAAVSPGFFKWNKAIFIAQASALVPTPGPSWIPILTGAWTAACSASVITPGLVSNPSVWQVSSVDALTLPIGAATIPTISLGQGIMSALLQLVPLDMQTKPEKAPEDMAKAIRAGVLAFVFTLIGISGTVLSPVPTPIPAPAH